MFTTMLHSGWSFSFHPKDNLDQVLVHCTKSDVEAIYQLDSEIFDVINVDITSMNQPENRLVRKLIFKNFDYLVDEWKAFHANPAKSI